MRLSKRQMKAMTKDEIVRKATSLCLLEWADDDEIASWSKAETIRQVYDTQEVLEMSASRW